MQKKHVLDNFFYPDSIAVVGASKNPAKAGYQIFNNFIKRDYEGRIYPVNPGEETIQDYKCYNRISEIEDKLDLVIITIPSQYIIDIVREAADRGDIRAIIVVSAGFGETKTEEGKKRQQELVSIAREANIRIFGPNCSGVMNTAIDLDTTIQPITNHVAGKISIFSQSGAMGGSTLLTAEDQPSPLGYSKWAHVGNMCDVDIVDILSYYGQDPETDVIVLYMEGFEDGRRLIEAAREITPDKPVIVLKVGRNELGAEAAYSHTGALAGRDEIYEAAFRKSGITRAEGLPELVDAAKTFSLQPLPEGNQICIFTEAGGPGTMAMDELGKYSQARMATISEEGKKKLKDVLHDISLICEPEGYIDMTAAAMEREHKLGLNILLEEENVDAILLISVPPNFLPPESLAGAIIEAAKDSKKPVLTCLLAGKWVYEARRMLEEAGLPTFDTPEQAIKTLVKMIDRRNYLEENTSARGGV